jgi:hypothetical protein
LFQLIFLSIYGKVNYNHETMKKAITLKEANERIADLERGLSTIKLKMKLLNEEVATRTDDVSRFCDRLLDAKWCKQVKKSNLKSQKLSRKL